MGISASARVHPSAVVEAGAVIGAGCRIGPFCHLGPDVVLAADVELKSHVVVAGFTEIGAGTIIWPFASIGHQPQDLKFKGERTRLVIGRNNRIREHATMNPGTEGGGGVTRIGDGNLLMMSVHIGHDCVLGNNIVMANNATLGGHVVVGDNVVIGGLAGVHQFCRIGQGAMVGFLAAVSADVVPYGTVAGQRATLDGLNLVGLKRRGINRNAVNELRSAFRNIFQQGEDGAMSDRVRAAGDAYPANEQVQDLVAFLLAPSQRSFTLPGRG